MKGELTSEFRKHDPNSSGTVTATQWCEIMKRITGLDLPWRTMKDKLVKAVPSEPNKVSGVEASGCSCRLRSGTSSTSPMISGASQWLEHGPLCPTPYRNCLLFGKASRGVSLKCLPTPAQNIYIKLTS